MKQINKLACGLMLCASLGVFASCGNTGKQSTTDTTGTSTDSLMSNTGADGNASPAALPGDTTTTRPDTLMQDTSKSRRP